MQEMPGLGLISLRMVGSIVCLLRLWRAALWLGKDLIQLFISLETHILDSQLKNYVDNWNVAKIKTLCRECLHMSFKFLFIFY